MRASVSINPTSLHRKRLFLLLSAVVAAWAFTPGCNCGNVTNGSDSGEDSGGADSGPSDAGAADSGSPGDSGNPRDGGAPDGGGSSDGGQIRHVIIIMQENRSFDHYFGTYPGVDGILLADGGLSPVCLPEIDGGCVMLFHDRNDINGGGPHTLAAFKADVHDGGLDGFVKEAQKGALGCPDPNNPTCTNGSGIDPVGYHDGADIPNYWAYASHFVLQDHMYEPNDSWSNPEHLYLVSEWAADCTDAGDPMSCTNAIDTGVTTGHAWTDLTYLLHKAGVSWKYYLGTGNVPDCDNGEMDCPPKLQDAGVPSIWNPLPAFTTVQQDGELGNIVDVDQYYVDIKNGTLPSVAWIIPESKVSEHPAARVTVGQAYVTALINALMQSPYWSSTVIFLSWDDWGGFYDHSLPPVLDQNGYGIRVPGMVISPFAKAGTIDHQVLSHDAYAKFIEDVFLGSARLDPLTDGRPDPRPSVRENLLGANDLINDLDLSQTPLPPLVLSECPYDGGCLCPLDGGACRGAIIP
jgi:phospholipase C